MKILAVSPAVITVKEEKSVKIALDSRKLNDITIKRKAQMPNMEELISIVLRKITLGSTGEIWISTLRLRQRIWSIRDIYVFSRLQVENLQAIIDF